MRAIRHDGSSSAVKFGTQQKYYLIRASKPREIDNRGFSLFPLDTEPYIIQRTGILAWVKLPMGV